MDPDTLFSLPFTPPPTARANQGMTITDWKEMENLWTWHMVTDNARDAARIALTDTSVDIFANPTVDTQHWIYDLVAAGDVPQARVDASAGRVLALKESLGLLDDPFALLNDTDPGIARLVASVGSEADKVGRDVRCEWMMD